MKRFALAFLLLCGVVAALAEDTVSRDDLHKTINAYDEQIQQTEANLATLELEPFEEEEDAAAAYVRVPAEPKHVELANQLFDQYRQDAPTENLDDFLQFIADQKSNLDMEEWNKFNSMTRELQSDYPTSLRDPTLMTEWELKALRGDLVADDRIDQKAVDEIRAQAEIKSSLPMWDSNVAPVAQMPKVPRNDNERAKMMGEQDTMLRKVVIQHMKSINDISRQAASKAVDEATPKKVTARTPALDTSVMMFRNQENNIARSYVRDNVQNKAVLFSRNSADDAAFYALEPAERIAYRQRLKEPSDKPDFFSMIMASREKMFEKYPESKAELEKAHENLEAPYSIKERNEEWLQSDDNTLRLTALQSKRATVVSDLYHSMTAEEQEEIGQQLHDWVMKTKNERKERKSDRNVMQW